MALAVRDHKRVAVRSCHGIGKTKGAAFIALWFLYSFPHSKIITTAPTWTQVEDLLWREIRIEHENAATSLGGKLLTAELEIEPDWFALGLSTDKPERFQGHHAPHVLLIVDEASGVENAIFEAGEGYLTTPGARLLAIGNPTQTSGQFFDAFHSERALWHRISISAFDSPNFTDEEVPEDVAVELTSQEWVDDKKIKWGEQSPLYQVRVLGEFPTESDDTVVKLGDIERSYANGYQPTPIDVAVIGCDVARFGSDETVISVRQGKRVRISETYIGRDTMETAGRIIRTAKGVHSEHFPRLVVDDDGVGGGVTDRLRELGYQVTAFRGGQSALDSESYPNARSELWFTYSELLPDLDMDDDDQLAADLVAPHYKLDSQGRRVVERKDETKKRIGRSPDRADSVLLCYAPEREVGANTVTYVEEYEEPVVVRGDLKLKGDRYVDKPPEES